LLSYDYVTSAEALGRIAREVEAQPWHALDLETTALNPRDGLVRLCSINTGVGRYVIDLFKTGTLGPVVEALDKTTGLTIGQNLKFDQKWLLWHFDLELKRVFDTFRASNLLYNGYKHVGHDLYSLYRRELNIGPEAPELGGSDWTLPELTKDQLDYAAEDITHLPALRDSLRAKLIKENLVRVAVIEFNAILPEAAIELNGFGIDQEKWKKLAITNAGRQRALEAILLAELPSPFNQLVFPGMIAASRKHRFNLDSPEQVLESMRRMGVTQKIRDPESNQIHTVKLQDTKEMTLAMLAASHPIIEKFIEYRGVAQRVKSFGAKYLNHVNPKTGRIHTEFWPFTGAGRYSSSKPNLQQIPRDKDFRACFVAGEGYELAIADYSNIEMRLVAEISGDKRLIAVFNAGPGKDDAHRVTASLLSGIEQPLVSKDQRQQAKPVNFGFIYGMQAPKLVLYARAGYGVTLSEGQAIKFRRKWFEAYSGVEDWHTKAIRDAKRQKAAWTIWGRRRFLDPETEHNAFFNSPVQGSGADGLKNSLPLVYKRCKAMSGGKMLLEKGARVGMVHMVHDENVVQHRAEGPEFSKHVQKQVEEAMIEGMAPMMKRVPATAETGGGPSWASKS